MLDFNGDLSTSSQMLNRADELEDARQSIVFAESSELRFLDPHKTNLDIFDERNAVLGISIESADFARIISVNAASRHVRCKDRFYTMLVCWTWLLCFIFTCLVYLT